MIIRRSAESTHWYLPDGTPFYEVQKKDGSGPRPAHVGDAFKAGAYRSVTNVLGVVGKPGLVKWQIEQAIISALTLPRIREETEHQFAERVIVDSEQQTKKAAEFGTLLHAYAADFLANGSMPKPPEHQRLMAPFFAWINSNVNSVITSEEVVINPRYCYAGRLDAAVEMKSGGGAIIDIKTQDVKLDAKGQPKPAFYNEWAMQLAAYGATEQAVELRPVSHDGPWRLISLVLNRNQPGLAEKEWTEVSEAAFAGFSSACGLWTYLKGGTPGRDACAVKAA